MESFPLLLQIRILQQQIELEESNYNYAVELRKDYNTLRQLGHHIRESKQLLQSLIDQFLEEETKKI